MCYNQCKSMTPTSTLDDDEVQRQHEAGNIRFHCNSDHWPLRRHLLGSRGGADTGIQMGSPDCVVTPPAGVTLVTGRADAGWLSSEWRWWGAVAHVGGGWGSLVTCHQIQPPTAPHPSQLTRPLVLCTKTPWKNYLCDLSVMFSISFLLVSIRLPLRLRTSKRMSGVRVAVKVWHRWGIVRRASCPRSVRLSQIIRPPPTLPCVGAVIWVITLLSTSLNTTSTSHPVLVQPLDGGWWTQGVPHFTPIISAKSV